MINITSETLLINAASENIFDYVADFNHFDSLLPKDKITDWHCTNDSCSFSIPNLAKLALRITDKKAPDLLVIGSEAPSPFNFEMKLVFEKISETETKSTIFFDVDVNAMMGMMIKNPLNNFVNILNKQLKEVSEK